MFRNANSINMQKLNCRRTKWGWPHDLKNVFVRFLERSWFYTVFKFCWSLRSVSLILLIFLNVAFIKADVLCMWWLFAFTSDGSHQAVKICHEWQTSGSFVQGNNLPCKLSLLCTHYKSKLPTCDSSHLQDCYEKIEKPNWRTIMKSGFLSFQSFLILLISF